MSNLTPEEWIKKLNSKQRMHMIELNMNPLNPKHIASYLNGKVLKTDVNENIERARAIIGEDAIKRSLGHSKDAAFSDPMAGQEYTPRDSTLNEAPATDLRNDPDYIRNNMKMEMDSYASNPTKTVSSANLLSLTPQRQQLQEMDSTPKLNEAIQAGKTLATNYYNAFIKSIQAPSTQSHLQVFKALKTMLEQEKALNGSQLLQPYQKSVNEVATQMYKNLTKQLND